MNIANLLIELYISQSKYHEAQELVNKFTQTTSEIPIEIHVNHGICTARLGEVELAKVFIYQ